jgi:hypothetical protein
MYLPRIGTSPIADHARRLPGHEAPAAFFMFGAQGLRWRWGGGCKLQPHCGTLMPGAGAIHAIWHRNYLGICRLSALNFNSLLGLDRSFIKFLPDAHYSIIYFPSCRQMFGIASRGDFCPKLDCGYVEKYGHIASYALS